MVLRRMTSARDARGVDRRIPSKGDQATTRSSTRRIMVAVVEVAIKTHPKPAVSASEK